MPYLNLKKIQYSDNIVRIYASVKSRRSKCPFCGKYSNRIHDYYFRKITDLPVFQNRTVILLKTRKFKCGNHRCHRKVFSEQTPDIIRYSRRTGRATSILETFAIELTGRLGSLMSKQQNLVTILGIYPPALKKLAEAAEDHSYGVALAGANGDVIVALSSKPELVADNIEKAGGVAVITKVTKHGLTLE